MSIQKPIISFRKAVARYIRDHPKILTLGMREQNELLYTAFGAVSKTEKSRIREAKMTFYQTYDEKILDEIGTGWDAKTKKTKEKTPKIKKNLLNPKNIKIWELPDDELKKLFKEFVGYVDEKGKIHRAFAPEDIGIIGSKQDKSCKGEEKYAFMDEK